MPDDDLLASIDRGRAAARLHVEILADHERILKSGVDPLPLWSRRLALENDLAKLRSNYTAAELARFGLASPSDLVTFNPAHSIVRATRDDLQTSIDLSRALRDSVHLQNRILAMREASRLESVAREALKTAGIAAEGAANIIDRFLKVVGDAAPGIASWGVVAVVIVVLILLRRK